MTKILLNYDFDLINLTYIKKLIILESGKLH